MNFSLQLPKMRHLAFTVSSAISSLFKPTEKSDLSFRATFLYLQQREEHAGQPHCFGERLGASRAAANLPRLRMERLLLRHVEEDVILLRPATRPGVVLREGAARLHGAKRLPVKLLV